MLDRSVIDKLFTVNESLRSAGMGELSDDEIRSYAQKSMQPQIQGIPEPMRPPMQMPQQGMMGMVPPQMGQPMGDGGMMGQMSQPNGSGFDTHIHIGQDGKLQALNIKRAVQKRMQQGGLS